MNELSMIIPDENTPQKLFQEILSQALTFKNENDGPGTHTKEVFIAYFLGMEFSIKFKKRT